MAKDIVYALVTFDKTSNNRQVARILGVDHKNIKRAIERRHTLDNNRDTFWLQKRTRKRVNVLCEATVQHIVAFWTLGTIISPNSKDVT
jgi:phage regulator Rha-like protein